MKIKFKNSVFAVVLNILVSLAIAASGIYTLIEKKMIISGKYSGNLYSLGDMESFFISASFFLVASFFILVLFENKKINKIGEWFLILGIIIFLTSSFVN